MAKIGVFGGTFNPPHLGHVLAAKAAKEALGLSRVLLIPDGEPPHKRLPAGSPPPEVRLRLTETAAAAYPWLEADGLELQRPGKSFTSDTLRLLHSRFPGDTLYLLMGTDMFLSLHTWHEPEAICHLAVIVAMNREVETPELLAQKKNLETRFGAKVELLGNQPLVVSSSHVRRLLILGGAEQYVDSAVLAELQAQGLYGTGRNYKNLSAEELRDAAISLLKPKRVSHVLGCAETAVHLAKRWGADPDTALRAGLLHDVTKAIDGEDQLLLVKKYDILISDFERSYPKVLHAKTGAAAARYVFGESDEVCSAICWHTTGRADMSLMEKIIYLADYIEPTRSFAGVEELRELADQDLDRTLLKSFDMVIAELIRENKRLCRETPEARDFLCRQLAAKA